MADFLAGNGGNIHGRRYLPPFIRGYQTNNDHDLVCRRVPEAGGGVQSLDFRPKFPGFSGRYTRSSPSIRGSLPQPGRQRIPNPALI